MRKLNHEIINTVRENNNYKIEKIIDEKRRHKVCALYKKENTNYRLK